MALDDEKIENPGSAIGEAIGAALESKLNSYLEMFVDQYQCRLISKGPVNNKTKKATKLLLFDNFGTPYNIDAVITNEANQPIIVVEYKYIRYKKHNRDKGSWLCTAHSAVRRRYGSIRSSIAILAGSWSGPSLAMMQSHDIKIFLIPFEKITALLLAHGIKFDWGEKDRHIAVKSWEQYCELTDAQKDDIAEKMIADIKTDLEAAIEKILDNDTERSIEKIAVEIHTNIGEVKRFEFNTVDEALDFLEEFSFDEMLDTSKSFTIFDLPVIEPN
jgi:hypothetical protein